MRKVVYAALTATILLPLQVHTADAMETAVNTAADLLNVCAVADDDPMVDGARGFCYGFLSGAAQYHRSISTGKKNRPLYCLPAAGISRAEAAKLFVAWGRANPQHLSETPIDGLTRFAVATWPCATANR